MQAAGASDKVASRSKSPVVIEIRGSHHMHTLVLLRSMSGGGRALLVGRARTGQKAFAGEALPPADPSTLKFNPLVREPKIPIMLLLISCRKESGK